MRVEILNESGEVEVEIGNVASVADGLAAFLVDRGYASEVEASVVVDRHYDDETEVVVEVRSFSAVDPRGALDVAFVGRRVEDES